MEISHAQKDMREAYYDGATGAFISGLVWLAAGIVAMIISLKPAMATLFFGGMVIFPLSKLLSKALGRSGAHTKGNPLGKLAIESTFGLFMGLFIAFAVSLRLPEWFFSIMLIVIGVRYFVFSTVYGLRIYWVFAGVLCVSGVFCIILQYPSKFAALAGGIIEILFAIVIRVMAKRSPN